MCPCQGKGDQAAVARTGIHDPALHVEGLPCEFTFKEGQFPPFANRGDVNAFPGFRDNLAHIAEGAAEIMEGPFAGTLVHEVNGIPMDSDLSLIHI